ncbi:hypothetical protein SD77_1498 [Bacillus badius]|uniref:Uncharacterized protein n=1 Tax=Bacillus badius TaxID=1455 RepID=A0ABR5ARX6_BACBA|nr:hypothetical protein SD78_3155 [Bacillus badius]KIL77512.1 hypothetical protein SD77_1498 [Bacillus badius]
MYSPGVWLMKEGTADFNRVLLVRTLLPYVRTALMLKE